MTEKQETAESIQEDRREGQPDRRQDQVDRRASADRRTGADRRSGWDRRRGPGRRRPDERRAAEEGEMNDEQFELIKAIDAYKRANNRPFPTFTEILEIMKALGYRKVADPTNINGQSSD
jgi:hypothetical protein